MFEHRTDSINRSFRHQQSDQLSHAIEPCEFPIHKSRSRPAGSGLPIQSKPVPPKTRTRKPGRSQSDANDARSPAHPSITTPLTSSDDLTLYLSDALNTPLLTKVQERELTRQIFRYRQAFQRLILSEPAVIEYLVSRLSKWESNQVRIDSICNLGLSEMAKRKKLEPKIRLNLKSLRRLPRQIRASTSSAESRRIHKKSIRLVEEMLIRPKPFESAPFKNPKAHRLLATYRNLCQMMTRSNMRLVVQIARQICGRSEVLLDMIQEGNRGLMHAVSKFDHRCNNRFSTYATPWIKQRILAALPNAQRNIRIPENFRAVSRKVQRRVNEIRNGDIEIREADSGSTISLIATEMNMQPIEIEQHLCVQRDTCSLDQPARATGIADSNSNLGDRLPDQRRTNPQMIAQVHEREQYVRLMMKQALTRREQDVIGLRFGIKDGHDRSLAEVGRVMGLTRQRVCQVEKQALEKLGKVTQRLEFAFD